MKVTRRKRFYPAAALAAALALAGTAASAQCTEPGCAGHGCEDGHVWYGEDSDGPFGWYWNAPYSTPEDGYGETSPEEPGTEAAGAEEYSVELQDIVDANTGLEKLLGDHAMYGWTVIYYDEDGQETGRESIGFTREDDSYAVAIQSQDGTMVTYRNGSAWVRYADGTSAVQELDDETYAAILAEYEDAAFVGYSDTEVFTAQAVQDGQLLIQSQDPEGSYSDDTHMTCYYYAMDEESLKLSRLVEAVRDEDGNETKRTEVIVTTKD